MCGGAKANMLFFTVVSKHLIQPPSLSFMLCMPPVCPSVSFSLCLTHCRAIRPNSRSEVCSSVSTEDRESLCLWKLLLTEVNHQRVEDAPEITLWYCVWTGPLIEQTSVHASTYTCTQAHKINSSF